MISLQNKGHPPPCGAGWLKIFRLLAGLLACAGKGITIISQILSNCIAGGILVVVIDVQNISHTGEVAILDDQILSQLEITGVDLALDITAGKCAARYHTCTYRLDSSFGF